MDQENFERSKFDFNIKINDNEMEVSFPSFIEIDRAVEQTIKIARQFKTSLFLVFKGRRILVDKKSIPKDVMEKYIFG
jgi:hypothetical protein